MSSAAYTVGTRSQKIPVPVVQFCLWAPLRFTVNYAILQNQRGH